MRSCIPFFLLLLACTFAWAQPTEKPTDDRLSIYEGRPRVRAVRLENGEKITLDGKLDEPVWKRAVPATDFIQQDPDNGKPATERTEVRFAFSKDALYMGVICYDSEPNKLQGNQILRDGFLSADDRFMWVLDPYLNQRTGYFFETNPSGSMGDSLLGGSGDGRAWDGIWTLRSRHFEQGWMFEVELPFKTLNFDPSAPAWGVNFQRTVRRKQEESLWTAWIRNQQLQSLRNAGLLEGINDASQGVGLDIRPYFVGTFGDAPGRDTPVPFNTDQKFGVDMFYSLTPQLRANVTVNTDFAETEVDQRRVNLTQFPLFFPERRTFFLEGSGFFDFARWPGTTNVVPFFSRRIGLDANGTPQKIDYGAKLTGQAGSYDLGVLQVRTASQNGLPGEDFSVLRTKRRFFRESYIGILYTRRAERGSPNLLDPVNAPRHTAGFDFYLGTSRFHGNQNMQFSGFFLWNNHPGVRGSGKAYGIRFDYPNDRWTVRLGMREAGDVYDPAVGFYDRRGIRKYDSIVNFSPRPRNNRLVRRYTYFLNNLITTDLHNRILTREMTFQPFGVQFQSGDNLYVNVFQTYDRLAFDFNIYNNIVLPNGNAYTFNRVEVGGGTTDRRMVSVFVYYNVGSFYSGTRRQTGGGVNIRPKAGFVVSLNNDWNRIELKEGSFSTAVPRVAANYQFGPWKSIANTIQYDTISRILGWQSRFRWILKPGNDLYVVYSNNWISDLRGRRTLDRGLATKVSFTKRF